MFSTDVTRNCPGFALWTVTLDDDPRHAVTVAADNETSAAYVGRHLLHVAPTYSWEPVAPVTVAHVKPNPSAVAWNVKAFPGRSADWLATA